MEAHRKLCTRRFKAPHSLIVFSVIRKPNMVSDAVNHLLVEVRYAHVQEGHHVVLGLSCNATGVEVSVSDELQFIARASIIVGGPPRALIGQMGRRPEAARRGHQQICPLRCRVLRSIRGYKVQKWSFD